MTDDRDTAAADEVREPGSVPAVRCRLLIVSVVLLAAPGLLAGCGGTKASPATTGTAPARPEVGHAAPDLEALLPGNVQGSTMSKGSTTGAVVFGNDAFSRTMAKFLRSAGKKPSDLRFANEQDVKGLIDVETGVFEVRGIDAKALLDAIVSSSRPGAPGITVSTGKVAGKPVTKLVYPGSSVLYLYAGGDRVFYVGSQTEPLAATVLATYP